MNKDNTVKNMISEILKNKGFRKKSDTWYSENDQVIAVVNLQKSQYGEQYYINFALWIKILGLNSSPKEHQCPIRFRLGSILPECDIKRLESALDLDAEVSEEIRRDIVSDLFERFGLALLGRCMSLNGIRDSLADGSLSKAAVRQDVKEMLGT